MCQIAKPDRRTGRPAAVVRDSRDTDLPAIRDIYAHEVLNGLASFELVPPGLDEMSSRRAHIVGTGLPWLTAEAEGEIVGFAYAAPYRTRAAYLGTVEDSVYVARDRRGAGVGEALLAGLIARCEEGPWRQMVAVIGDSGNLASIALHGRLGFRLVGTLEAVGLKFGRRVDTVLMQRSLGDWIVP